MDRVERHSKSERCKVANMRDTAVQARQGEAGQTIARVIFQYDVIRFVHFSGR